MKYLDIETELKPNLLNGEKLLWTGRPKTGLVLRSTDAYLIPFSLLWGGFAFFWETTVISMDAPFPMAIFGIPFVLLGIYFIIGRFFLDAWKRVNTIYGITNDRIIIKSGLLNQTVNSLNIKTLSDISLNVRKDQSGTIVLGSSNQFRYMQGIDWPGVKQAPSLEFIDNVQTVYELIIRLQNSIKD